MSPRSPVREDPALSDPNGNRPGNATFGDSIEIRTEGLGPAGKDGVRSAPRDRTRRVHVGKVPIGGGAPVAVQSMTTTMTWDVPATLEQIRRLDEAGCEIVRVAVPDEKSADALPEIVRLSPLPVVADIHFTWKLGLKAIAAGVHKVRINPGNIGGESRVQEIVAAAKDKGIPIRVGANAGSLPKEIIARYGVHDPLGIVEAALIPIGILEKAGFEDIVVSMKASDVGLAVASYRLASKRIPYPLHIGITEAGSSKRGSIKSAVGLGMLLEEGIGDTMRVSLTADPVEEIETAFMILSAVGLRQRGPEVISCPSCGRCDIDLIGLATTVENRVKALGTKIPLKVAVMGCEVNGPGEARDADVGIAGGLHEGLIFKNGEILRKVKENMVVDELMVEVEKVLRIKEAELARGEAGA